MAWLRGYAETRVTFTRWLRKFGYAAGYAKLVTQFWAICWNILCTSGHDFWESLKQLDDPAMNSTRFSGSVHIHDEICGQSQALCTSPHANGGASRALCTSMMNSADSLRLGTDPMPYFSGSAASAAARAGSMDATRFSGSVHTHDEFCG